MCLQYLAGDGPERSVDADSFFWKVYSFNLRLWRNWQTRTFEGRVEHSIWVQVPSAAPKPVCLCISVFLFYFSYVQSDLNPKRAKCVKKICRRQILSILVRSCLQQARKTRVRGFVPSAAPKPVCLRISVFLLYFPCCQVVT